MISITNLAKQTPDKKNLYKKAASMFDVAAETQIFLLGVDPKTSTN